MKIEYVCSAIVTTIVLAVGIPFVEKVLIKKSNRSIETIFLIILTFFHLADILISIPIYGGYNLRMLTPLSNISPFLFTLAFLAIFLPEKARKIIFILFVPFNIVMVFAAYSTTTVAFFFALEYFPFVLCDSLCHVFFFLFVYYLIRSNSVEVNSRNFWITVLIIYTVITIAIILNLMCDTAFFGLAFNDKYNIYGLKIIPNMIVSNIVFLISVFIVMGVGFFFAKLIKRKK